LAIIITQKVTRVTSHHLYFSMCAKCPSAAQTQVVDSSGPLAVDVSFQFFDLQI